MQTTTTKAERYQNLRSVGYPSLIAYRMAKGDNNARFCGMLYSGKHDCQAYVTDIRYSGWIWFINV